MKCFNVNSFLFFIFVINKNWQKKNTGEKFLCSEVIAPIRSEVDDISLYIINFEDLSSSTAAEALAPSRLSKCKCESLALWIS